MDFFTQPSSTSILNEFKSNEAEHFRLNYKPISNKTKTQEGSQTPIIDITPPKQKYKTEPAVPIIDSSMLQRYANMPNDLFKLRTMQLFDLGHKLDVEEEKELERGRIFGVL